jgi:hypothetical protein
MAEQSTPKPARPKNKPKDRRASVAKGKEAKAKS